MCFAFGKQIQAIDTWATASVSMDKAKEPFHTESFAGVIIYVLKDGTVEVRENSPTWNNCLEVQRQSLTFELSFSPFSVS